MKKIAFITPGYLPVPSVKGGAVEILTDMLIEDKELGEKYEIDVYSIYDEKAEEKAKINKNVNYIYLNTTSKSNLPRKYVRYFINRLGIKYIGNDFISILVKKYKDKLAQYDYVIVENKPEYGLYLDKYVSGKMIFHSHNDFLNKNTRYAKAIFDVYDEIYCLSNYICRRVSEIRPQNSSKIKLLYNGVDIDKFDINIKRKEERKKYNISENDVVFLYTGRLVPEKGIKELIKAFNLLDNDYKLLIAGSISSGKTTHNKFTKELYNLSKNNKNIIFTGYIDYAEIPQIYSIADYGVIPSVWEEPFALTVVEHLASGHPVIVTNSGAMPELIDEKCAIVIEKEEIINNLKNALIEIGNNEKYKYLSKDECKINARRFSKEIYIKSFKQLLDEVIK